MIDPFGARQCAHDKRLIVSHDELGDRVRAMRTAFPGLVVVLVMGAWDLKHVGHDRYIALAAQAGEEEATKHGNPDNYIVIVGVDADEKIRAKKGDNRPIVSQGERIEQVCHLRYPTFVTLKNSTDPHWGLIELLRPDVLIATQETYSAEELEALKEFCGQVRVNPPQAETSTTARIRVLMLDFADHVKDSAEVFRKSFHASFDAFLEGVQSFLDKSSKSDSEKK